MSYRAVLCALLLAGYSTTSQAGSGKLGIIGDSIARATHADDDCGALDIYECLEEKLGRSDPSYSFAGGDQPWSLRRVLEFDELVDASRNGARWRDAPQQAEEIARHSGVQAVLMHMGSNDVCRPLGKSPPPLTSLERSMEATLAHLTDNLPPGGVVYVSGLVDIVQLRDLMVGERHIVFESCQALWDLDFSRIQDSAVEGVCAHFFGSSCFSSVPSFFFERSLRALRLLYETLDEGGVLGLEGSCGNVLNSESTATDRRAARGFNLALNRLMMRKAEDFAGRNGVRVHYVDGLFEERMSIEDVSILDCFHPSRIGQRRIASVLGAPLLNRRHTLRSLPSILQLLDSDGAP